MDTIKTSVIDGYGQLARRKTQGMFSKLFACCDPGEDHSISVAAKIGYAPEDLRSIPKDSNLGVSCGNPSDIADIQKGEVVVDLGSGAGFDAFIVAPIVGQEGQVIGIDLSEDMLALANKNKEEGNYPQVRFLKGDIEELPLAKHTADLVISNCVINLSVDKRSVFEEAFRVLKPGGRLAISDVILEEELPAQITQSLAGHLACISGAEKFDQYFNYVKEAGFTNINIHSKSAFPLELMLADPQIKQLAEEMDFALDSKEAKELASSVVSVTYTAVKS